MSGEEPHIGKPPPKKAGIRHGVARWLQPRFWSDAMATSTKPRGSTVDAGEVERFSALADTWWDQRGKMAVLHRFNPVRLCFIKEAACGHFDRDGKRLDALAGLRILD